MAETEEALRMLNASEHEGEPSFDDSILHFSTASREKHVEQEDGDG